MKKLLHARFVVILISTILAISVAISRREALSLCVVADVADLWAMERTSAFHGQYHILGGLLSALDGIGPEQLSIGPLLRRLESGQVKEVILALGATLDGQSTAHYLADRLAPYNISVTRLAHGLARWG